MPLVYALGWGSRILSSSFFVVLFVVVTGSSLHAYEAVCHSREFWTGVWGLVYQTKLGLPSSTRDDDDACALVYSSCSRCI
ncbi:hypothetical protein FRC16_010150 [Serendipita sp. 398]|nr:hypothetical protein FRC16_010150 [Serendipita sp. 398]